MKKKLLDWLKSQHQEGDCFWILRGEDNNIIEISEIDRIGLDQDQADNLFNWDNDDTIRGDKTRNYMRQSGDPLVYGDNELVKINLDNPSDKDIYLYSIAYNITQNRKDNDLDWFRSFDKKDFSTNRHMDYGCGKLYSINRNPNHDWSAEEMVWRLNDDVGEEDKPYKDYYLDWCRREGKELPAGDIGYCEMTDWLRPALWADNKEHPDYAIQEELYDIVADSCDELWLDQTIYTESIEEGWELDSIQFNQPKRGDLVKLDKELYVLLEDDGEGCWEAIQPCMNKASLEFMRSEHDLFCDGDEELFYWQYA